MISLPSWRRPLNRLAISAMLVMGLFAVPNNAKAQIPWECTKELELARQEVARGDLTDQEYQREVADCIDEFGGDIRANPSPPRKNPVLEGLQQGLQMWQQQQQQQQFNANTRRSGSNYDEQIRYLEQEVANCFNRHGRSTCEQMRVQNLSKIERLYRQQQIGGRNACATACTSEGQRCGQRCLDESGGDINRQLQCSSICMSGHRICLADC